jgi:hypothetical protein
MPADLGHNSSHIEGYQEQVSRFKADAAKFGPVSETNAQLIRDHIGYGGKLAKEIDKQRDEEKRPHLEAGRMIDAAYKPLVSECDDTVKAMKRELAAWMDAREREARRIAEEKARALREAEEAAARAQEPEEDPFLAATAEAAMPDVKAAHAEAKTAEAEVLAASRVSSAAGGFKAAGLKTVRKAKVTDYSALVAHYATHPDMQALAERLVNADIRHAKGAPVSFPGVEIIEERVL